MVSLSKRECVVRTGALEFHARDRSVILGRNPLLHEVARYAPGKFSFQDVRAELGEPGRMARLRAYLCSLGTLSLDARSSDTDVLRLVEQQIQDKRLAAVRLPVLVERRMETALAFLIKSGASRKQIGQVMGAIDFGHSVEAVTLPVGTPLYRLGLADDPQGSWYTDDPRYTADQRAISAYGESGLEYDSARKASVLPYEESDFHGAVPAKILGRRERKSEREHVVNHPVDMLKSIAKGIPDHWSLPIRAQVVRTKGGAIQYYAKDFSSIR